MDYILEGFTQALFLLFNADESVISAIKTTLFSSSISIVLSLIVGFPLGFALGFFEFKLKRFIKLIVDTSLSFPTVAVGLILYALISSRGPLGDLGLLFTVKALILGQFVLALPIVIALFSNLIENMNKKHFLLIKSLHLSTLKLVMTIIYELRFALVSVVALAYGRIVAEVGVAMIVGGNIKYDTRTITTAISLETNKGEFASGIALALVLIFIAFILNFIIHKLKRY
ncbi:ABC transporter permease subunit [Campylobacter coli]|uniref:ABC transporter permease subunit n=2 Tax=Campylobacter coli TaxID=195 RepID=A0A3X8RJ73_CAMCO|nr:tungstate ABC transporter permease TupB [Campylobacter coli]EAK3887074.1 ABC transporter permease subunit [Campylobacter hyointestinalis]EAK5660282.1 ABC transporter permease subunit [Campylobacter fetus]EIA70505.1 putative anion-uptake ABC-transport system permease protein [Campylobacter coli 7--1]EIA75672.1 putative anion-uptake ABC-transport system permease protein [Campylobacter coli 1891]EIA75833.1 putative anion-uptake ABC-transport system permease protein [Campylobacter coli 132-6]